MVIGAWLSGTDHVYLPAQAGESHERVKRGLSPVSLFPSCNPRASCSNARRSPSLPGRGASRRSNYPWVTLSKTGIRLPP